ncbi:MAG TPA: hypothetical protein V6C95_15500 [Coleofasciculaceae cyanobacterium]
MPKKEKGYYSDYVSKHGKAIHLDMKRVGLAADTLIDKALEGDSETLKKLGEMLRRGQIALDVLPLVEEALTTHSKATEAYNKTQANVLKAGSKAALGIKKARVDVSLANQRHGNESKEIALRLKLNKQSEKDRHSFAMGYERLKSYISAHINQTEQVAKLQQTFNQPAIKQIQADADYQKELTKHLLDNGDNSQPDLIPKRVYQQMEESQQKQPKWLTRIKQFVGVN